MRSTAVVSGRRVAARALPVLAELYGDVQLATLTTRAPAGEQWTYELKLDGYRILALKSGGEARLLSRRRQDWTEAFRGVARSIASLGPRECVLDGELCALDARGIPSFQLLQNRGNRKTRLVYFVFDLLALNGVDLRARPLAERRAKLAELLDDDARAAGIVLSASAAGDPATVLKLACEAGLEGIVAKDATARYVAGRTLSWRKIKCGHRQELAIVGWLPLLGSKPSVGSLILAAASGDGELAFAGKVGTGFTDAKRKELHALLLPDLSATATAANVPRFGGLVHFVRPRHVAEVTFTEWTSGGHVRHPSFIGLRPDKTPSECVREAPAATTSPDSGRADVAGISISHPERRLDPTGITKLELARYYESVAPMMLPHVRGRPLTLLRWAEGKQTEKGGVYVRHARAWGPKELRRVRIQEQKKTGEYLVVESEAGLVALAQMDILEIHTWSSIADDVERPDRLVFDLDPAPDVGWDQVVSAALDVRKKLRALRLESWVKLTGGKGLHVVVPIEPDAEWDRCFAFTRDFARSLVASAPRRYVATMAKSARGGRIFVDYLRNNRTSTSVAAYSTRARPGAPVSLPIRWRDLGSATAPAPTMAHVLDALRRRRADPWAGYWSTRQKLPA